LLRYLYEPLDATSKEYRVHDIGAQVKTSRTLADAVIETLRLEDRLLAALDPALLVTGPYGLWPEDVETVKLRDLRDYFQRFPHLPYLESEEVLRNAIVKGVRDGLFEVGLKQDDLYPRVWRRGNPPAPNDFFFADHYLLARPGVLHEPERPEVTVPEPPKPPIGEGEDKGTPPVASKKKTQVRLAFSDLSINDLPKLVDVAYTLEDARGTVRIEVSLSASNPAGLDETTLELSVRELLDQQGLKVNWQD
jgi:hypothetical protein